MRKTLLAEFSEAEDMLAAARRIKESGCRLNDAYSPFPVEEMAPLLGCESTNLRVLMFLGGLIFAAGAYATEGWSAIYGYPINSGGRPLNSWPAFMLFPFAVAIFGAALAGFITLIFRTGLPALHHPLFAINSFERATQDRFFLALEPPPGATEERNAKAWLRELGAVDIKELEP